MRGIWCTSLSGEREAEKLRDVLQKFLQALARRIFDQHLRIAIFRNPAFVDKESGAKLTFSAKPISWVTITIDHPFFSEILGLNLQHFTGAVPGQERKSVHQTASFSASRPARGNRHALLLTTRKFGRVVMCTFCPQTRLSPAAHCASFFRLSSSFAPRTRSGPNMTFSSAVRCGKRVKLPGTPYLLPGESGARQLSDR